jgi:predicted benzoate:H+ symporter BenE
MPIMKSAFSIMAFLIGCAVAAYTGSDNWTGRIFAFLFMVGVMSIWLFLQYRKSRK